jgi:uncharacterized protein (DUF885 family)
MLRSVSDEFWDTFLAAFPTFATTIGDRRFDDRLEDPSPEAVAAVLARFDDLAARVAAIDQSGLSPAERVTRSMLEDELGGQAAALRSGLHEWTVDHLSGPNVALLDLVDHQDVHTVEDGERLVRRWRGVGAFVDATIDNLRRAVADGRVAARAPVERTLAELDALLAKPPTAWKMAAPAEAAHDDWPAGAAAAFREAVVDAVAEDVAPAFRRYRDALRRDILPAARTDERVGLGHVPGGDEAYAALIRVHTTLELDPADINRLGLDEIARIDAEFVELGRRVLGTTDLATTLAALRDDPALRFGSAEEVFATAETSLRRAEAAVPAWFGRVPHAPCDVLPVPEHAQEHQTIAYYLWPTLDGSRPGRYYVNLYAPETRPRYEAEALAFHESVPGHHLQIAIAEELPGIPTFQRALGSTAFAEGWGLYAERLSDEMGLYSSDLDRFGVLSFDAWRAGRLVVDTGMHALGWSRDRAIAFLRDHTALAANNIVNEVDRYIVWPGQALAYKLGQLEILRLRAEAKARLGAAFDIRAFHDAVLGSGAVSLPTLRSIVAAWLDEAVASPAG